MKKYFPLIFQRSKEIISDLSRRLVLSSKHHSGRGILAPMCSCSQCGQKSKTRQKFDSRNL